jgi:hypothetical protein
MTLIWFYRVVIYIPTAAKWPVTEAPVAPQVLGSTPRGSEFLRI